MNNRQIVRAYSIKEVSQKLNIPTGTIRQWEKDLSGILDIPRTQQGARYYTDHEIKTLAKIKEMREQNVSKGMIRSLLEKYLGKESETESDSHSESLELAVHPAQEIANNPSNEIQTSNMDDFHTAIALFKQDLLYEIKNEILLGKKDLMDEIKNEFSTSSLQTVKELSKSIQRSNDKRKVEVLELSNTIMKASEQTSETFAALSNDLLRSSEVSYEQLSKQIDSSARVAERDSQKVFKKVAQTLSETKNEIRNVSQSFDAQQDYLIESINDLKQSQEEIRKREEIFQSMLSSYREVAAAKKKKWWKIWS